MFGFGIPELVICGVLLLGAIVVVRLLRRWVGARSARPRREIGGAFLFA